MSAYTGVCEEQIVLATRISPLDGSYNPDNLTSNTEKHLRTRQTRTRGCCTCRPTQRSHRGGRMPNPAQKWREGDFQRAGGFL